MLRWPRNQVKEQTGLRRVAVKTVAQKERLQIQSVAENPT